MRVILIAFLVALLWPGQDVMAASADDFLSAHTSAQNGTMPYRFFVPPGYDENKSYPLILFLHGAGERGNDNSKQLNNHANGAMYLLDDPNLAEQPVFMIAPQCPSSGWWGGATVRYALSAIDDIAAQYNIDPDRIYITGLSMGGMGTWSAITQRPGLFAAAVPMSGNGSASLAPTVAQIPFWFFHADNDPTVSVDGSDSLVSALRKAGARTIYTRYDTGGHGIWSHAYRTPMLFHWLVSQRRGQTNETAPPTVHIAAPTSDFSLFVDVDRVSLAGTADNGGNSIADMAWDVRDGDKGTAGGTTDWSTSDIALAQGPNLVRVVATGSSYYAPYGGNTTFNDTLQVTRANGVIFADGFELF